MWAKNYVSTDAGKECLGKIISLEKQAQECFNGKDTLGLKMVHKTLFEFLMLIGSSNR